MYKPRAILVQEQAIKTAAILALPAGWMPTGSPWSVDITCNYSDKRRRDIDNHLKLLLDVLNKVVYLDDSQIVQITIQKCFGAKTASTDIILIEL